MDINKKRLTIRHSEGRVSQPSTTAMEVLFYRLAAYEDTGLEPEEIITGKELAEIACGLEQLKKYQELGNVDRLRELAEADKEKRCVVLPCKVGDIVFCLVPQWVIDSESNEKTVHGKWQLDKEKSKGHVENIYICSACSIYEAWGETEKTSYCPNCGARMHFEE